MEIRRLVTNIFEENTYIIWDAGSLEAAVVDPGMQRPQAMADFGKYMRHSNLRLKYILLTHGHLDHTFGVEQVKEEFGLEIMGAEADEPLLMHRDDQARRFRLPYRLAPLRLDRKIADGDELRLGSQKIIALAAPGHSPGSLVYYVPESGFVLTGDVLFRMGIGRTDLPGGSQAQLLESIRTTLFTLPADTVVYPGHGPATTIGAEKVRG